MQQKNRVILIHGLHQTAWIMRPLAKRLQAAGFDTYQFGYLEKNLIDMLGFIRGVLQERILLLRI